jgi:arylsulfatase A-like enzyme
MSTPRISRRALIQGGIAAAALARSAAGREAPRRPNLLYVFPDQFRPFAMGFMHADPVLTPNLDRFAAQSVVFSNAVSNYPVCSPYRAMLLTGRWPHSTGVTTNCNTGTPNIFLRPEERCFSDVLAEAGYCAGYIGKWHLDTPTAEDARYGEGPRGGANGVVWDAYTPPGPRRHGFSFWHAYGCCDRHLHPHYWVGDAPVSRPTAVEEWSVKHETDVAVDFIANRDGKLRDPEKPFALFVAFNPPHPPYNQVPEAYKARYAGKQPEELLNRPNVPPAKGCASRINPCRRMSAT